jgi:hypothetical protein
MLFGYETVSYDYADYGKYFWQEWNKGKSFSTAFLDASWHLSHRQAPSVVACGATRDEAKHRVFNERLFSWAAVSHNWWWWRWYNAASAASGVRSLSQTLPSESLIAELEPNLVDGDYVNRILRKHDVRISLPKEVAATPEGVFALKEGDLMIAFEKDGSYELQLARPNIENHDQISMSKAMRIAEDFVRQHGLDQGDLIFDCIMFANEGGGSDTGSGQIEGPYVTQTVVQFTQQINGLPVLLPGKGSISVAIDNDGKVTGIKNSTRIVTGLTGRLKDTALAPEEEAPIGGLGEPEQMLAEAWQRQMKNWVISGRLPVQYKVVPGTYEIGYAIKGNEAVLVARNDIEVDCGQGYLKRYSLEVPIIA